jgi:hypothetical protein
VVVQNSDSGCINESCCFGFIWNHPALNLAVNVSMEGLVLAALL